MAEIDFLKSAQQNKNVKAFQHVIRCCEGTDSADGFNYLFGSTPHNDRRFTDMSKHPNRKFPFGENNFSDAAGAYQIMYKTWNEDIQPHLHLPDFSENSQDIACLHLISERDCLQKIMDGNFDYSISRCNTIWASLPGSPYGQPVKTMDDVIKFYQEAGGIIA